MSSKAEYKKAGFLPQRQDEYFALRVKISGGHLKSVELETLARLAEQYGQGEVHLTARQGLEIPHIHQKSIEDVKKGLAEVGLTPAVLGPGMRTLTACPGMAYCSRGLTAPQEMVKFLEDRLDDRGLPHKFKVGLTACPNNCLKAEANDVGLKGGLIPRWARPQDCIHCGLCQKVCPTGAITVTKDDLIYDEGQCIQCGLCYNKCPGKCWDGKTGWHLFFGGLFGRNIIIGQQVFPFLTEDVDILAAINRCLDFYREHGNQGERLARAIDRLGWKMFENYMRL